MNRVTTIAMGQRSRPLKGIHQRAFLLWGLFAVISASVAMGQTAQPAQPATPGGNQNAEPAQQGRTGLDYQIQGPVQFVNQDLDFLLAMLQSESGVQIVKGDGIKKNVTFNLMNPTVRQVLDTVLPPLQLAYNVNDSGVVYVDTKEKIDQLLKPLVELVNRTFSPRFVDVTQLQEAIGNLRSSDGQIIVDPDSQKIIVTDTPEVVEAIEQMIQQLDVQTEMRVFPIRYGNAQEIADQLQGVINTIEGELFVDIRNNLIIIKDTRDRLDAAQAIIEQLDVAVDIRVIPLAFALPDDVLPIIETLLSENGFIDFDPRTSRLIVQDIPSILDQITELIEQLDIATQQVYVEADIVQISHDKSFSFGTKADFGEDIGQGGDPSSPGVGSTTGSVFSSFNPFLSTSSGGLTLLDVNQGTYRFQIDMMVSREKAEVIASPRLLIQDGGIGSFNLGSQEPFATQQRNNFFGSSGDSFFTQQFRNVGTTINLEVYASEAGYIEMFIGIEDTRARRVELANLGDSLAVDGSFIDTSVTVKSGRTVVLGGIINRSNSESRSGVPILSSIPIIGGLFSNKSKDSEKQKLLVFITPRLVNIDDPYDFAQVDNVQRLKNLRNSGATGFLETDVDDAYLDWSNEEENEQQAVLDALQDIENTPAGSAGVDEKAPSFEEQMEEGVVRMKRKK